LKGKIKKRLHTEKIKQVFFKEKEENILQVAKQ